MSNALRGKSAAVNSPSSILVTGSFQGSPLTVLQSSPFMFAALSREIVKWLMTFSFA